MDIIKNPQVVKPKPAPSILEFVSTVEVVATKLKFSATAKFVVNTSPYAQVKISKIGNDFIKLFLAGKVTIEKPMDAQTLRYHDLCQTSADTAIIAELGGEEKSETTLYQVFSLMKKQKHGKDGALLNNHWANIFFIRDNAGVLRTVSVRWRGGGWCFLDNFIENQCRWFGGVRVFSRNSVKSSETSDSVQA